MSVATKYLFNCTFHFFVRAKNACVQSTVLFHCFVFQKKKKTTTSNAYCMWKEKFCAHQTMKDCRHQKCKYIRKYLTFTQNVLTFHVSVEVHIIDALHISTHTHSLSQFTFKISIYNITKKACSSRFVFHQRVEQRKIWKIMQNIEWKKKSIFICI